MIRGSTAVFAVLGHPVRHSRSPALHNRWIRAARIDAVYVALMPPIDAEPVSVFRAAGLGGANLTRPFKEVARPDAWDPVAARTGAINTLVRGPTGVVGLNTDVLGFQRALADAAPALRLQRVVVLGAGGAAAAVIVALQELGARTIAVHSRSTTKAIALAHRLGADDARHLAAPLHGADLVVNTTARDADLSAVPTPNGTTFDINYGVRGGLVGRCRGAGLPTFTGEGMLRHQAALAFTAWFGHPPPLGRGDRKG